MFRSIAVSCGVSCRARSVWSLGSWVASAAWFCVMCRTCTCRRTTVYASRCSVTATTAFPVCQSHVRITLATASVWHSTWSTPSGSVPSLPACDLWMTSKQAITSAQCRHEKQPSAHTHQSSLFWIFIESPLLRCVWRIRVYGKPSRHVSGVYTRYVSTRSAVYYACVWRHNTQ